MEVSGPRTCPSTLVSARVVIAVLCFLDYVGEVVSPSSWPRCENLRGTAQGGCTGERQAAAERRGAAGGPHLAHALRSALSLSGLPDNTCGSY